MTLPITNAELTIIQDAGFTVPDLSDVAMTCGTHPRDVFACTDWTSLAFYALSYDMCDCGGHRPTWDEDAPYFG